MCDSFGYVMRKGPELTVIHKLQAYRLCVHAAHIAQHHSSDDLISAGITSELAL